ncbi:MAG: hypothetical protein KAI81_00795 [Candidatus Marinimicrobia bacterium]|nr:hypothetical protein [Candidatus Neomarinimicrobiota bacterium]
MLNKIKFELDDDEIQELQELVRKILMGKGDVTIKMNGTLKGLMKNMEKEIHIHDDFKKRDMW